MKLFSVISPSKPEFDETIKNILRRSEYAHLKNVVNDFIASAKEGIAEWIGKMLRKIFSNLENVGVVSDKLSTIFIIIGILVILGIVILVVIKTSKTFEKSTRIKEILGEKISDKTTPYSLRAYGDRFAGEENFRQAVRYEFIALLFLMHEKNLLYLDETKTNEEIYNYLKKNNFYRLQEFHDMIINFNNYWYGHRYCNPDTYKHWKDSINLMWDEVVNYEEKIK